MFNLLLTTPLSFLISLAALAGVTLHDTKIDKLATSLVNMPVYSQNGSSDGSAKVSIDSGTAHTHVERVHLNDSMQPRIAPRNEQKKHMMQKHEPRGKYQFDGYNIPL